MKGKMFYKIRIKDMPEFERPRERLIRFGPQSLNNSELLAILLRTGTKQDNVLELSNKLLAKYDLSKLSEIGVTELKNIYGIGDAKACQIVSVFELMKRFDTYSNKKIQKIKTSSDAAKLLMKRLRSSKKEHFYVLFLDVRHNLLKCKSIFTGTISSNAVYPREIFKEALVESAAAVIFIHNHPSGDPTPSDEDIQLTNQMRKLGTVMSVEVLDHIIIGNKGYTSMKETGVI
ncbi:MAG: DNA repair protein RadC [Candidatus Aenigmarchaeota archaeon]|nr:DNA repair protein RadC [Candidatus Aenigmarchaeota archaeon]